MLLLGEKKTNRGSFEAMLKTDGNLSKDISTSVIQMKECFKGTEKIKIFTNKPGINYVTKSLRIYKGCSGQRHKPAARLQPLFFLCLQEIMTVN